MKKKLATTALTASLLGGGAVAIALAPTAALAQDEVPAETTETETTDRSAWLDETLSPLVTDGTITQSQADAVADAIRDARPERGERHGRFGAGLRGGGEALEAIGLDLDTVRSGLADGMNLGEIAEANGISTDAVVDALVDQMTERLDQAVENGRLTEQEAADKAAEIEERANDIVDGTAEFGRRGHGGPGQPDAGS